MGQALTHSETSINTFQFYLVIFHLFRFISWFYVAGELLNVSIILTVKMTTQLDKREGNFPLEQKICSMHGEHRERSHFLVGEWLTTMTLMVASACLSWSCPLTWLFIKMSKEAESGGKKPFPTAPAPPTQRSSERVRMLTVNIKDERGADLWINTVDCWAPEF